VTASSNDTPCALKLADALVGSHSKVGASMSKRQAGSTACPVGSSGPYRPNDGSTAVEPEKYTQAKYSLQARAMRPQQVPNTGLSHPLRRPGQRLLVGLHPFVRPPRPIPPMSGNCLEARNTVAISTSRRCDHDAIG
jgi:hypothetical protein